MISIWNCLGIAFLRTVYYNNNTLIDYDAVAVENSKMKATGGE